MNDELSERRMRENEVVFRRDNESVEKKFAAIKRLAKEANQEYLIPDDDTALYFYCECSDENCRKRIQLKPSAYARIHENRSRFILIGGHETKRIETVVEKQPGFWIVEKHVQPPETVRSLQPTGVDNV